jgi:hypothetical protein
MLPDYADIRAAISAEPSWFDGNGVPRYAPFTPKMLGVYDDYVIYAEIECQNCGRRFYVGEGYSRLDFLAFPPPTFAEIARRYHYGDPPFHAHPRDPGGMCGGTSMNVIDVRIVEAWERVRDSDLTWRRRPDIEEVDVMQDWAKAEGRDRDC